MLLKGPTDGPCFVRELHALPVYQWRLWEVQPAPRTAASRAAKRRVCATSPSSAVGATNRFPLRQRQRVSGASSLSTMIRTASNSIRRYRAKSLSVTSSRCF